MTAKEEIVVHEFISGNKYSFIDSVVRPKDAEKFKIGDVVSWDDPDIEYNVDTEEPLSDETYTGKIGRIFLIDEGHDRFSIEISLDDVALGRLPLNDIYRDEQE